MFSNKRQTLQSASSSLQDMGDYESYCGSRAVDSSSSFTTRKDRQKVEIYNEILRRLIESNYLEASRPGFDDELWTHFDRLPFRYVLDVNVERPEDVLMHQKLLQLAHDPSTNLAIKVRQVQAQAVYNRNDCDSERSNSSNIMHPCCTESQSANLPPAFGYFPNLELALEVNKSQSKDGIIAEATPCLFRPMHEITLSTPDKPKFLSKVTSLVSDIGLNIQEAHAFSTVDGYSLDVFLVDGWGSQDIGKLENVLIREIPKLEKDPQPRSHQVYPVTEMDDNRFNFAHNHVNIRTEDVWEIDARLLRFEYKISTGAYDNLYKGNFRGQDVAIKLLKSESLNEDIRKEFAQEVYIMRKVRHKNVLQFIGASTRPPTLCIVTEFMSGGNVYAFLQKQKGGFDLPQLLKVAIDVAKGMNYLHENSIIHRDLKAANLLMDENAVVKVGDFGVARVLDRSGNMTSETGTYRWMAPEVIEHKPYDQKADVYSYGVVLWELLTGKLPYEDLTPVQAAVGVVQEGLRPPIPKDVHPIFLELMQNCWQNDPTFRPEFSEILDVLQHIGVKKIAKRL